ncbi:MAG: IS66 family transposase [Dehalococcoidia bacterium]
MGKLASNLRSTELPNDVAELRELVLGLRSTLVERDAALAERDARIASLKHHNRQLRQLCFGRSSERRAEEDPSISQSEARQGWLFALEIAEAAQQAADEADSEVTIDLTRSPNGQRKQGQKRSRRKKFPSDAPVVTTRVELPEDERRCSCGCELHEIGVESSRELERIELTIIHQIDRVKYACRNCEEGVRAAKYRGKVIEKGILGPGFLAHVITEHCGNHMPFYRLEKKYASEGLALSRSVLQASYARCAELVKPIVDALHKQVLASEVIYTDDTPVTIAVTDENRPKKGRVWIYLNQEGVHWYDFTDSRKRDGPQRVLGDFAGYVHADAYPGYDQIFLPGEAVEVGCWSHVRRKFLEAEASEPELAAEAIAQIKKLFLIERHAKKEELDAAGVRLLREENARPILKAFGAWMDMAQTQVLPKGPLGKAITYAQNQWEALKRYVEDGRLELSNNAAERALRPFAVGRKNWLFFQRESGGVSATILMSLLMTCKAAGVNPREYFRDVLVRIASESDVEKLVPHAWKRHFEPEVRERRERVLDQILARSDK